jgi:hypothetical protein
MKTNYPYKIFQVKFILFFSLILTNSCSTSIPTLDDFNYIKKVGFLIHDGNSLKWGKFGGDRFFSDMLSGLASGLSRNILYQQRVNDAIISNENRYERALMFLNVTLNDSTGFLKCGEIHQFLEEAVNEEIKKVGPFNNIVPIFESVLDSALLNEQKEFNSENVQKYINSKYGIHGMMKVKDVSIIIKSPSPNNFIISMRGKLIMSRTDKQDIICSTDSFESLDFAPKESPFFIGRELKFYLEDKGETFRNDIKSICKIIAEPLVNNFNFLYASYK